MKLLVVRHAIALDREEWAELSRDDRERPLTEEGASKMKKIARNLRKLLNEEPSCVISSPLLRAKQTADLLIHEMPSATLVETETLAPEHESESFVKYLRGFVTPGTDLIACVGHEPHLNHLIAWMVSKSRTGIGEMKKGGACLLEFPGEISAGQANLIWLMTSRQLRGLT